MKRTGPVYKFIAVFTSLALFTGIFSFYRPVSAYGADQVLTLKTARALALENSSKYESAEDAINSKQAAMDSSLKSLRAKKKNMSTFRWTPLLNFKFPQKANFAQESEFQFKPLSLANDILKAQHKKQDVVFDVNDTINKLFTEIVTLQENIKFNEQRVAALEDGLKRNTAKLKMGEANQSDIDRQQKKLDDTNSKIASDRRTLEADLKKLSKQINLDVTTGYTFEKPYVEAKIDRSSLQSLIDYTEDRDETYYEACVTTSTARTQLATNFDILRGKYGGDINMISSYVNAALNGQSVSSKAFKADYKRFLEKIDSYWDGNYYIWIPLFLVIVIPKEWLKGDLDGIRYIEDDPYTLYQNVLDYISARKDEQSAKDELDQQVEDQFNNYISVRNSYETALKQVAAKEEDMKAFSTKNKMGLMTFEEYQDEQDDYEELQNGMLDTMKLYTDTLYSFDRLTCGGVSALLSGTDADMHTAVVGESYVTKDTKEATYYLKSIIHREMFELSVYIPDDFEVSITDFELWCDNEQIGERTPVDGKLRHLKLAKDKVDKVMIRLYDGDKFVDDCVINPDDEKGVLNITTKMDINKDESGELGTYNVSTSNVTGFMTLEITPLESEGIAYFKVFDSEGKELGDGEMTSVKKGFTHLGLVSSDLDKVKLELYDENKALKYKAYLDTTNKKIKKDTGAAAQ